jgi:hypothetical protein
MKRLLLTIIIAVFLLVASRVLPVRLTLEEVQSTGKKVLLIYVEIDGAQKTYKLATLDPDTFKGDKIIAFLEKNNVPRPIAKWSAPKISNVLSPLRNMKVRWGLQLIAGGLLLFGIRESWEFLSNAS